jgi:2-C-methyl-D-erythritol 4-phosphate cytidylyltransferase
MTGVFRTAAILVAGGTGERFGRVGGKQLARVAGLPVLAWSLLALDASSEIDLIVIVCPVERAEEYRTHAVTPIGLVKPTLFAPSGVTRQDSVASGLAALPATVDVVAIHDGARPLITPEVVSALVSAVRDPAGVASGAVVGHPSYDTLKVVESCRVTETVDRERFWAIQTPQVFVRSSLEEAHSRAVREGFVGTDDAAVVERAGGTVLVIEGPRDNIKVTVAEDLAFAEAVLGRREGER